MTIGRRRRGPERVDSHRNHVDSFQQNFLPLLGYGMRLDSTEAITDRQGMAVGRVTGLRVSYGGHHINFDLLYGSPAVSSFRIDYPCR